MEIHTRTNSNDQNTGHFICLAHKTTEGCRHDVRFETRRCAEVRWGDLQRFPRSLAGFGEWERRM